MSLWHHAARAGRTSSPRQDASMWCVLCMVESLGPFTVEEPLDMIPVSARVRSATIIVGVGPALSAVRPGSARRNVDGLLPDESVRPSADEQRVSLLEIASERCTCESDRRAGFTGPSDDVHRTSARPAGESPTRVDSVFR